MPPAEAAVRSAAARLVSDRVAERVWQRDASLWPEPSPGAAPAADCLGWLDLPDALPAVIEEATGFAAEVRAAGFRDAVLLGMGGSSLASEVARAILPGGPEALTLHVLDSTVPAQIAAVQARLDLTDTLFLLSSKSGTTAEPLSLYRHFRAALEAAGAPAAGSHFAAVTDPGTPLEDFARVEGFRRVFRAPPDVGGRFSALSVFGVVPAALICDDLGPLARAARIMANACRDSGADNPGMRLGAVLGGLVAAGRDKVTLITPPVFDRLGLWIEQLLAESTGKLGKGLIPIAGESFFRPDEYGADRQFVYVRPREGNDSCDGHTTELERAGQPVERVDMPDPGALWAEFFRWEFAVAAASSLIGVYPFDQPDVNLAKDRARDALSRTAGLDTVAGVRDGSPEETFLDLLARTGAGDYLAIGAFLPETEDLTDAFGVLRQAVTRRTGIASTFGYGPRYLHSTGQLHKGGPDSAVMLLITAGDARAMPIPGEPHGFDSLAEAQAAGDLDALRSVGRRAATVSLSGDYPAAVRSMAAAISQ